MFVMMIYNILLLSVVNSSEKSSEEDDVSTQDNEEIKLREVPSSLSVS